ncbi:O-antigen ligase family protein [Streptomyces sp. DH24]|uniref:O-antigen ligase family protein n=1 Tax=Streptomyces sp. DH24 TaxID=3040123 RepID=UPI00244136D6|nr:O-antigen ligase family protein [Streptomyces sp. DH24]MDG9716766.1 O-antigen ligase family protein [Streptomyces sp. DH24]
MRLAPPRAGSPPPVLPVLAVVALLALPLGPGGEGGAGPADAASALVVLYCAVRVVRDRRRPLPRTAAVVFGLPVAAVALAALGAVSPGAGITGFGRYVQVFVLVPAVVLLLVRDRRDFRLLAWSIVALAGWQGAVGVHQYVTGTGASYQGEAVRAVGTFGAQDVMGMATVVSLGLVCAVGLALGRGSVRHRAVAAGCALLLVVPLAMSFSRGAWIATALTCAAQLLLAGLRRALRAGAAVVAAGVVLVGGFGVGTAQLQERISSITQVTAAPDQSVTDRYTMWAAAVGMWREHPLTGVGLKGFPEYRDSHASLALSSGSDTEGAGAEFRRQPLLSPHNMYLLVLAEQGLLGLLALAGGWLALLVCALRGLPKARRSGRGLDCGLVACGLLVWLLTDFAYADIGGSSTVLTALCLGLAARWALAGDSPGGAAHGDTGDAAARTAEGAGAR